MRYHLSTKSEENLSGVDPHLAKCVRRAIVTTSEDFGVFEGMRTLERQRKLVASGASRTLDSYHLTGHAVDLVPYVDGRLQWQMPLCIQVAIAMRDAAVTFGVPITWGAVWDRKLQDLDPTDMAEAIDDYAARYHLKHGYKSRPLIDGPHFQVAR